MTAAAPRRSSGSAAGPGLPGTGVRGTGSPGHRDVGQGLLRGWGHRTPPAGRRAGSALPLPGVPGPCLRAERRLHRLRLSPGSCPPAAPRERALGQALRTSQGAAAVGGKPGSFRSLSVSPRRPAFLVLLSGQRCCFPGKSG